MKKRVNNRKVVQNLFYRIARFVVLPYFSRRFALTADKEPDFPGPYMVIANHVTELDFILIAKVFKTPLSFVVGHGLLRNRLLAFVLLRLAGVIPKQKAATDARTTLGILRRLQSGRNVCLFAEGNTTFSGQTGSINPATGILLRSMRAGLVTCRIEGAYFAMPRWGKGICTGRTACRVINTYSRETLESMSAQEINQLLKKDLWEDAYERQACTPILYSGRQRAQGLEYALYLCPCCRSQNTLRGEDDQLRCNHCGASATYREDGILSGDFPHRTILAWTIWQREQLAQMLCVAAGQPIIRDEWQQLMLDERDRLRKHSEGPMIMGAETLTVGNLHIKLLDITGFEIYRKNIIQFTLSDGRHFQTAKCTYFNALKYRDLWGIIRGPRE